MAENEIKTCPWEFCDPENKACTHIEPAKGETILAQTEDGGWQRAIYIGRLNDRYGISAIVDVFDNERFLRSLHPSRIKPFDAAEWWLKSNKK